jgi:DUF971 family protein
MQPYPTALNLSPEGRLQITWSDQQQRSYSAKELRDACPCATCREKRTAAQNEPAPLFQVLTPEEARPLKIEGMRPVGNYAYGIAFSDGHDTGIYTLELLRELGRLENT